MWKGTVTCIVKYVSLFENEPTDKAYDIIVADMFKYVCILQIAVALEILSEFFIS